MDFVTALNVTIYGLGIVFLALLVVMFAIMVLSRLFAAATGKDFMAAPAASEQDPPAAPSQSLESTSAAAEAAPAPSSAPAISVPLVPVAPASPPSPARLAPLPSSSLSSAPAVPAVPKPLAAGRKVTAPLPGKIISIAVKAGDSAIKGEELCVIEAMKMNNSIRAQWNCTVHEVLVSVGDTVPFGVPLFVIE